MKSVKNKYFTCIGKGHGAPCLPATREDWEKLRKESWLAEMCDRIERGDEQLKHRLPVWTPHCAEFRENHRAIADAVRPLNRLMLDFDEKGHTDDIMNRLLEKSPLEVLLIEESVRRGTHVLVELPEGMSAEEAQTLMKAATGFEPDAAVKDVSRCIYMVSDNHTKYLSDRLFEADNASLLIDHSALQVNKPEMNILPAEDLCFKGVPYATIIAEYWRRTGGMPAEGERNVKLHKLAVNLRAICDNKKDMLMQVMPRFGLSDTELRSIVDSACKEEPKGVSKLMQQVVDSLAYSGEGETFATALNESDDATAKTNSKLRALRSKLPVGL